MNTITKQAVAKAGGPSKLSDVLGISRQAIEQWTVVPPKHVLRVEEASGISRHELRPDIYGEPPRPFRRRRPSDRIAA
jgi:DNA-binding transcriptional regulator YdaS (Cro superfamily)